MGAPDSADYDGATEQAEKAGENLPDPTDPKDIEPDRGDAGPAGVKGTDK